MPDRYTPEDAARVERVLACELLALQKCLNICDDVFARILAITKDDVVRMRNGEIVIAHDAMSFKIGVEFVRLFRLLCKLARSDRGIAREWLYNPNTELGGVPTYIIQDYAGLHHVIDYLKSRQSLI